MKFVRPIVETPRRRRATAALAVLLAGGLVAAGSSVGGGFPFGGGGASEPDLILVNGAILTMDDQRPRAAAIALTDDEITAVGSSRSVAKARGARHADHQPARPHGDPGPGRRAHARHPRRPDVRRRDLLARRRLARGGARQGHRGGGRAGAERVGGRGRLVASEPVHGEAAADGRRPDRGLAHEPRLRPVPLRLRPRQRGGHRGTRPQRLTGAAGARDSRRARCERPGHRPAPRRHRPVQHARRLDPSGELRGAQGQPRELLQRSQRVRCDRLHRRQRRPRDELRDAVRPERRGPALAARRVPGAGPGARQRVRLLRVADGLPGPARARWPHPLRRNGRGASSSGSTTACGWARASRRRPRPWPS